VPATAVPDLKVPLLSRPEMRRLCVVRRFSGLSWDSSSFSSVVLNRIAGEVGLYVLIAMSLPAPAER